MILPAFGRLPCFLLLVRSGQLVNHVDGIEAPRRLLQSSPFAPYQLGMMLLLNGSGHGFPLQDSEIACL